MPDRHDEPLDALRTPVTPLAHDPGFASALRHRLMQATNPPTRKEPSVSTNVSNRPRNGVHHGDVSYITLSVPDLARGQAFYGHVLGWRFSPGSGRHGAQVDDVVPMIGMWEGDQPDGGTVGGAVLGFRVDDINAAVAAVRAHGGVVNDPHREPYAIAAEGRDNQGIPFYLHEMPSPESRPDTGHPWNGEIEGDISYLTMVAPDLGAAQTFYGAVVGWTFNTGRAGGAQVNGVAPQIGITTRPEAGPATPGVIMCYRVDDLAAAAHRVRDAGGRANEITRRPYGLESLCADDQDIPFYLHQF